MTRGLLEQADRTPVTLMVLVAYLTLAVLTGFFDADPQKLLDLGAAHAPRIANGEPWRLLTYSFLHGGLLHLAFNTLFLVQLGPVVEERLGSPRFALLYVVAALAGGVTGTLWHDVRTPLVGGSGAAFGIMGAALALNMRQGRHTLDFLDYHGPRQLVALIVVNLLLGALLPMVSNAAHVGGLLGGFVLVFCFVERGRAEADRLTRVLQAGWLALLVAWTLYSCIPVARWDYLFQQVQAAADGADEERRSRLIEALLRAAPPDVVRELQGR
jgi:rhomboid protease GluP